MGFLQGPREPRHAKVKHVFVLIAYTFHFIFSKHFKTTLENQEIFQRESLRIPYRVLNRILWPKLDPLPHSICPNDPASCCQEERKSSLTTCTNLFYMALKDTDDFINSWDAVAAQQCLGSSFARIPTPVLWDTSATNFSFQWQWFNLHQSTGYSKPQLLWL